jgi:hypothetical protein
MFLFGEDHDALIKVFVELLDVDVFVFEAFREAAFFRDPSRAAVP